MASKLTAVDNDKVSLSHLSFSKLVRQFVMIAAVCLVVLPHRTRAGSPARTTASSTTTPPTTNAYADYISNADSTSVTDSNRELMDTNDDDGWDYVPWLDSSSSSSSSSEVLEASQYEEHLQVFSPSGRLHFVEAAVKASRIRTPRSNVVIALHCRGGIVAVSTVPTSPYLDTTTSSSSSSSSPDRSLFLFGENENGNQMSGNVVSSVPIFDIHPYLIGATAGNAADGQILRQTMIEISINEALESSSQSGPLSSSTMARALADRLQKPTQTASNSLEGKLLASTALIIGGGKGRNSREIWRIDPTAQFWKCHAAVAGADSHRIEEILCDKIYDGIHRKGLKQNDISSYLHTLSSEEAIQLACDCLLDHFVELLPPSDVSEDESKDESVEQPSSETVESPIEEPPSSKPPLSSRPRSSSPNTTAKQRPRLFWYGVMLEYGDDEHTSTSNNKKKNSRPKRRIYNGAFTL